MTKKVVIGLSGGVDSSVAAYLLKEQGYEVIGVTMQIWEKSIPEKDGKIGIPEVDDAKKIAEQLGIPHYVLKMNDIFREKIVSYFIESYNNGRTPNPCIRCNPYVKWEALMSKAKELGADYVATGHYAKIKKLENGRYTVTNADSKTKDQTYMLFRLSQEQLAHTLMPLGSYEKTEIREIAEKLGLVVAHKPDSQDMCFIPDGKYANFIWKVTGKRATPGNFVSVEGKVLGRHKGIIFYTVGQRKGLKLDLRKKTYVKEIRPKTNEVVVSDIEGIFSKEVIANNVNFMGIDKIDGKVRVFAKIRYSHKGGNCIIEQIEPDTIKCVFDEPQRAITPGQGLVVYDSDGNILLGGEII